MIVPAASIVDETQEKRQRGSVLGTERLAIKRWVEFGWRLHTEGLEGITELAHRLVLRI